MRAMKANRRRTTGRGRPARKRAPGPTQPDATASTRERLMTVAMRLFAEHGFAGTTVGDIEDAAGLTRRGGAFYRHFRSKEDILSASVDAGISFESHSREAVNL